MDHQRSRTRGAPSSTPSPRAQHPYQRRGPFSRLRLSGAERAHERATGDVIASTQAFTDSMVVADRRPTSNFSATRRTSTAFKGMHIDAPSSTPSPSNRSPREGRAPLHHVGRPEGLTGQGKSTHWETKAAGERDQQPDQHLLVAGVLARVRALARPRAQLHGLGQTSNELPPLYTDVPRAPSITSPALRSPPPSWRYNAVSDRVFWHAGWRGRDRERERHGR